MKKLCFLEWLFILYFCVCRVQYATGEEETLDLGEVIRERQMNLLM